METSARFVSDSIESKNIETDNGDSYLDFPLISQHKEKVQAGKYHSLVYLNMEQYQFLWWTTLATFPHWMNKGEVYQIKKEGRTSILSWKGSDMDGLVEKFPACDEHLNKSYPLFDGEVTVKEAIDYFEQDYLSSLPMEYNANYSLRVTDVGVYEITPGTYGYVLFFTTAWKGIPIDSKRESISSVSSRGYSMMSEALMVRKDDVEFYVNLYFYKTEETEVTNTQMISLADAIDICSETLSHQISFDVSTVDVVYKGDYDAEYKTATLRCSFTNRIRKEIRL